MCGSKIWTVAAFLCSGYFAKIAWDRLHGGKLAWSHQALDIATHLIWIVFMAGLIGETRCWKERLFFVVVLINFSLAFGMGIWSGAPEFIVRETRIASLSLWVLAALLGGLLIFSRDEGSHNYTAAGGSN
jgi:hypothetical protein